MRALVLAMAPAWLTVRAIRGLLLAWVGVVAAVSVAGLWLTVAEPSLDQALADYAAEQRADLWVAAARALTVLTQSYVILPAILLAGLMTLRRGGDLDRLWVPALAVGGGFAVSIVVKLVVARPRPDVGLRALEAFGPAFPSGHAIRAAAVAGGVAWLLSHRSRRLVPIAWPLAMVLPAAVAIGRVYQGAHWPTDVLVGAATGLVWLAVVARYASRPSLGDDTAPRHGADRPADGLPVRR